MIIKMVITKNKQEEPSKVTYIKWDFITNKSEEVEYEQVDW